MPQVELRAHQVHDLDRLREAMRRHRSGLDRSTRVSLLTTTRQGRWSYYPSNRPTVPQQPARPAFTMGVTSVDADRTVQRSGNRRNLNRLEFLTRRIKSQDQIVRRATGQDV